MIPREPEFEDWATRDMSRSGESPDEYCNRKGYNYEDIIKEPNESDYDD